MQCNSEQFACTLKEIEKQFLSESEHILNYLNVLETYIDPLDNMQLSVEEILSIYNEELNVQKNTTSSLTNLGNDLNKDNSLKKLQDMKKKQEILESELTEIETSNKGSRESIKQSEQEQLNSVSLLTAKTCKLLTGTNFNFQGPNVSGLIKVSDSNFKTFDLDPSKLSKPVIIDTLWNHLVTMQGQDWSDIFN